MRTTRRTPFARHVAAVAPALLVAVLGAGCTAEPSPDEAASPPPTALTDVATPGLVVARADPCEGIPADALEELLDAGGDDVEVWQPGDPLPDSGEVGDEFGCRVTGPVLTASAWVFAPPVERAEARSLVREAVAMKCARENTPSFGDPGVAFSCVLNTGQLHGVRGLVGDAWVGCEVLGPTAADVSGPWCAAVLESLAG